MLYFIGQKVESVFFYSTPSNEKVKVTIVFMFGRNGEFSLLEFKFAPIKCTKKDEKKDLQ